MRKRLSVIAWLAVLWIVTILLYVLFSVNVLFRLNEMLMLSVNSFLFFLFICERCKNVYTHLYFFLLRKFIL